MRSYLGTMLATGIGSPFIYLYAMGVGLAAVVDAGAGDIDGVGYLQFVAPALLASAALQISAEEFSYPIMQGFKWNPTFIGMRAAPLSAGQIIDGVVLSVTGRVLATSAVYYVFMLCFGAVTGPLGWLAAVAGTAAGLAFGLPLLAYVITIRRDTGQIAAVMRFLVLPLTLFSGTFFPLSQLPGFLQWIGWLSPLWHGTELGRAVAYGAEEPNWLTAVHVLVLVGYSLAGWLLARRFAARRLEA
ncbi:ABC transporter permease [Agromyces sp. MMS17-SY077]|uniref:Transport permease protein n=2 Tax=Agromyces seonyuensis TaxID=2662446 RepID=A0A6I4P1R7_9MICO|nr:ABC transporter permease [Agromyces seonyuensis]